MYYTYVESPIGPFFLAGNGESLSFASFAQGSQRRSPDPDWQHDPQALESAVGQIEEYFVGTRTTFDLELDLRGTEFQRAVWNALLAIPFGETRSYGEIARTLGKPGASRAVGAANGANTIPIIVPCHRVIGSNGSLTGFGGGIETKQWLLSFEAERTARQRTLF